MRTGDFVATVRCLNIKTGTQQLLRETWQIRLLTRGFHCFQTIALKLPALLPVTFALAHPYPSSYPGSSVVANLAADIATSDNNSVEQEGQETMKQIRAGRIHA